MDLTEDKVTVRENAPRERNRLIRLGGSILGNRAHICAFFHTPDDEYRVLLPFIKDGFECSEKVVHTVDPQRRDEHLQRLASAGIDVTAMIALVNVALWLQRRYFAAEPAGAVLTPAPAQRGVGH